MNFFGLWPTELKINNSSLLSLFALLNLSIPNDQSYIRTVQIPRVHVWCRKRYFLVHFSFLSSLSPVDQIYINHRRQVIKKYNQLYIIHAILVSIYILTKGIRYTHIKKVLFFWVFNGNKTYITWDITIVILKFKWKLFEWKKKQKKWNEKSFVDDTKKYYFGI